MEVVNSFLDDLLKSTDFLLLYRVGIYVLYRFLKVPKKMFNRIKVFVKLLYFNCSLESVQAHATSKLADIYQSLGESIR